MKLDRKQKILATLIIIAAAYLVWQIYDMFFANAASVSTAMTAPPAAQTFQPINTTAPTATTAQATIITMSAPTAATPTTAMPTPQQYTVAPTSLKEMTIQAPLTSDQKQYLQLVSRYQLIKMQRMVTDEEAALVGSKEKIAELNQQIAKFGGSPSLGAAGATTNEPSATSPTGYQLMYIDYQDGHWTATLNKNGQFQEANEGSTLSDGTQVLKIDQNGVVISQNNKTYLLNFYGSTKLSNPPPEHIRPRIISSLADAGYTGPSLNPLAVAKPQHKVKKHTHVRVMTTRKANTEHQAKVIDQSGVISTVMTKDTTPAPLTTNEAKALLEPPKTGLPLSPAQKDVMLKLESGKITEAVNTDARSNTADENYLLNLPNNEFTLQVLGSDKLSDLTSLMNSQQLQGKAYIFHTYYLGKDWYILVYGVYKSQADALNAINALPKELQTLKPWVRSITDVKAAIKLSPQKLS